MKSTCMTGRRNGKGFGGAETADAAADGSRTIPLLDYERFNRNNFSIRFRSWYYRGCWHQTCPELATQRIIYIRFISIINIS